MSRAAIVVGKTISTTYLCGMYCLYWISHINSGCSLSPSPYHQLCFPWFRGRVSIEPDPERVKACSKRASCVVHLEYNLCMYSWWSMSSVWEKKRVPSLENFSGLIFYPPVSCWTAPQPMDTLQQAATVNIASIMVDFWYRWCHQKSRSRQK